MSGEDWRARGVRAGAEIGAGCLAVRVRLLSRTITRIYDDALRPLGLTVAQLNVLSTIAHLEPAAAHDVAEMLSMEISTLSRNARLLQEEGLIEVRPAARGNGRVLSLSRTGAGTLERALPAWRGAQAQARELLGPARADGVAATVDALWAEQLGRPGHTSAQRGR